MSFERIGIGAFLSVDNKKYVKGMGQARDANGRFIASTKQVPGPLGAMGRAIGALAIKVKTSFSGIQAGFKKISSGLQNMAMGALPMTIALGAGVKSAINFEKQMSNVGAVTLASASDMAKLKDEAQRLGIVSTFSATQVGQAQEFLGRAGAKTEEIISSLTGVTNAAAADDMELASAADIVSTAVKGMGLQWKDATHVANVFSAASANSKTDIASLGEAFKMAMPTARLFEMSVEETATTLGKLHDAGLKGTMAGTTFTNMMTKLAKPSAKGRELLKKYKIALVDAGGKLRSMGAIAEDFSKKIDKSGNVVDKVAIASELFGLRGIKAFNALASAGKKGFSELQATLEGSSEAFGGVGVAGEMARRRLDNVDGAVKLLKSSLESFSIGLFDNLLKPMKGAFQGVTRGLNAVMFVMKALDESDFDKKMDLYKKAVGEVGEEGAKSALKIAKGVNEAIKVMGEAWDTGMKKIKDFAALFGESFDLEKVAKWAVIIGIAAGAVAPLILGLIALKFLIGGIVTVFAGVGAVLAAAFWPVVVILGIVALAFSFLRKENETLGETARRVWGSIKEWALDTWNNAVLPFIEGIRSVWIPVIESLSQTWTSLVEDVKSLFSFMFESFNHDVDSFIVDWKMVGQVFGLVFGDILNIGMTVFRGLIWVVKQLFRPIGHILQMVKNVAAAFGTMFGGQVVQGLKRLGAAMLDFVLAPIQTIVGWVIKLAETLGAGDLIPKGLRTFSEKGFTGLIDSGEEKITRRTSKKKAKIIPPKSERKSEFERGKFGPMPSDQELGLDYRMGSVDDVSDSMVAKWIDDFYPSKEAGDKTSEMMEAVKQGVLAGQKEQCLEANVTSNLSVDGDILNKSSSKSKTRLNERSGGKMTPWQYRQILESGSSKV